MDSPGGYQLVGRTLPIWNTWGRVKPFTPDAPWLLRFFDQVGFVQIGHLYLVCIDLAFSPWPKLQQHAESLGLLLQDTTSVLLPADSQQDKHG